MVLKSPKELEILGNLSENWKRFKQRFEIYLEASGLNEKKDKTKTAIFLNMAGENAIDIYNNFKFENEEDKYNLDIVLKKFEDYCDPLKNTTYERYVFFFLQDFKMDRELSNGIEKKKEVKLVNLVN
ncbi:hypothetical protein LAZ67_9001538 [Cordylochernes scorpioides]|uniref:Uncharacterized protein n=1 Tax=Cordylochernes scorpioides TaxID=51811 RepID=A0ABY6KTL5_9ARAC|nr:hypothetical protein LAZ67_9001538 [Cordylochernes scorpioides]